MEKAAFDELAHAYDAAFTHTAVGRTLRAMVWSRMGEIFHPRQHILELGCGTGEDALQLALAGIDVTATDASAEMIGIAREKSRRHPGGSHTEFRCVPMQNIATALQGRWFDGVFSNFGAVNCVTDLASLAASLATLLVPGAPLIWVVMGRRVPWEWLWYLSRGNARKALRRYQRNGVQWRDLTISYPTPAEVTAVLRPYFAVTSVAPLGCILPPTYAATWLNRSPRTLAALARLELLAQRSPALAAWSDHYILEARRVSIPEAQNLPAAERHSRHARA